VFPSCYPSRPRSVTSFPFVAVYLPESGRKIQRVYAHEGDVSGPELLRQITAAIAPALERRDALQAEEIARRVRRAAGVLGVWASQAGVRRHILRVVFVPVFRRTRSCGRNKRAVLKQC
jgi:hypothetical protein